MTSNLTNENKDVTDFSEDDFSDLMGMEEGPETTETEVETKPETEVETALREIKEETGLDADLSTAFRKSVSYSPAPDVMKEDVYFIAFAHTETIEKQDAEVTDFAWMPFNEALQAITYDNDKNILQSAIDFIEGMKN